MQREADSPTVSVKRRFALSLVFLASLGGCDRSPTTHETNQTLVLGEGAPVLDDGFTYITSVRGLSNGQLLLTDPRENRILLVDPVLREARPVSGAGQGPGEWSNAVAIYPMGADSSIQLDFISRRWLLFSGGAIVGAISPESPVVVATRGTAWGADDRGHVLAYTPASLRPVHDTRIGPGDSTAAVLVSRATGAVDTAAMLAGAPGYIRVGTDDDGEPVTTAISRPAYAVPEQTALFADGWMAIARLAPYRVDWRTPDGTMVAGTAPPIAEEPFTESEQAFYLARFAGLIRNLESAPAEMRETLMRRFTEFPALLPPFDTDALVPGGDGRLYIRRITTARDTLPRYDVFDRTAGYVGQITLGARERIVSVGARYVYVVWRDADDLERLRRHPVPVPD